MLTDDALMAIFDFCVAENRSLKEETEAWQTLVHVCRRWRCLVFESPRRLKLRLVCTPRTPATDTLDVWPALPLIVQCYDNRRHPIENVDNIVAVLERRERVCQIRLTGVESSDLEKVSAAMQVPFPELTQLELASFDEAVRVLPDSFLGGSAPRLQKLWLNGVPFPGLPKLLLSATDLTHLYVFNIPHSGYISPEAMVTALSTLTSLEEFRLSFLSPQSCPDLKSRRPPPLTRSVLPVLTIFGFRGVCDYLDGLVARIDTPLLNKLSIAFLNQIVFDTPQLIQFISRAPKLKPLEIARVNFDANAATVELLSHTSSYADLEVKIMCEELDWQISFLEQFFTSCLPHISTLEDLHIYEGRLWKPDRQHNIIENVLWLELLQPFTTVKDFYISQEFASRVVPALQELSGGRATEVLPTLQNIFLEELRSSGSVQEGIRQFVATRQASHPIAVSRWNTGRTQEVDG
jgi:hypothetical protein